MKTVLITGGTGLIGTMLTKHLQLSGYKIVILSRTKHPAVLDNVSYAYWNIDKQVIDLDVFAKADYVIHLAGAGIAEKRWTESRKIAIVESRVAGSTLLCKALSEIKHQVKKVVSASAIGWYGPDPQIPNPAPFVEQSAYFHDFLGETCHHWEQAIAPVSAMGIGLVILRTGVVLGIDGGAVKEFLQPLKFGFAAVMGSGDQMVSWIHVDDLCRLYIDAMENKQFAGVYNAVAPVPVNNRMLVETLAKSIKGRYYTIVPVPKMVLRLILGEMSSEILKSTTVSCEKLLKVGFEFSYPTIQLAMQAIAKQYRK